MDKSGLQHKVDSQYMLGSFLVYGVWHSYSFCFTCMEYQCMSLGSLYQAYIEFI